MRGGLALRFVKHNPPGEGSLPGRERVYRIERDGEDVGELYVWPRGSAVFFGPEGNIRRERRYRSDGTHVLDALGVPRPQALTQKALF